MMTGLLLSLGLITLTIGSDLKSYLIEYCTNSQFTNLNQVVIDLQDAYNNVGDNLMCTKACNCVTMASQEWSFMGYDLKGYNFTGTNYNVEACLNYDLYDYYSVQVMKELEEEYGCSGICTPKRFYLFGDVTV